MSEGYTCPECGAPFNTPEELASHWLQEHSDKRLFNAFLEKRGNKFVCVLCNREYTNKYAFSKHFKKHHEPSLVPEESIGEKLVVEKEPDVREEQEVEERVIEEEPEVAPPKHWREEMFEEMFKSLKEGLSLLPGLKPDKRRWILYLFKTNKVLQEDPYALHDVILRNSTAEPEEVTHIVRQVFDIRRAYMERHQQRITPYPYYYQTTTPESRTTYVPIYDRGPESPSRTYVPRYDYRTTPSTPLSQPLSPPSSQPSQPHTPPKPYYTPEEVDRLRRDFEIERRLDALSQAITQLSQTITQMQQPQTQQQLDPIKFVEKVEEIVEKRASQQQPQRSVSLDDVARLVDSKLQDLRKDMHIRNLEREIEDLKREARRPIQPGEFASDDAKLIAKGLDTIAKKMDHMHETVLEGLKVLPSFIGPGKPSEAYTEEELKKLEEEMGKEGLLEKELEGFTKEK